MNEFLIFCQGRDGDRDLIFSNDGVMNILMIRNAKMVIKNLDRW